MRLLKSQETVSIKDACRICGITPKHGYDLWGKYRDKVLSECLQFNWKPRRAKLSDEQQRKIEHLPPYSPELNPVERLFKELRRELKNRVFESLEAVEEAVIKAIKPFLKDGLRVKKLTFYGWLHTAPT